MKYVKQLIFAFVLGGWWWWPIVVINCPPTIHFKFITKCVKCYYKVRWSVIKSATAFLFESETILLQSVSMITKCERTTWEFLKFGISKDPARRDQRQGYWLPTWLSGVSITLIERGYTTKLPSKTDHPPLPTNSTSMKEEHVQWSSILQETLRMWKCTVTLSLNRRNGSSQKEWQTPKPL